jgi:hypothetical protein
MKKFSYLLSLAGHALLLLMILNARFPVTIRPEPPPWGTLASQLGQPRVVGVSIAEPPLLRFAQAGPEWPQRGGASRPTAPGHGVSSGNSGAEGRESDGATPRKGGLIFPARLKFDLVQAATGDFRLATVGRNPEPWATPIGPGQPPRTIRYGSGAFRPGAVPGGVGDPGGVVLLPFDIRERAVADWTEAVLSRIERNWFIPASGRLAFSGRVQITLTIERQGRQHALIIDDANVPEPLTQAALHAVQASLPLPPIPENVAGESLALTFVFSYNG